MKISQNAKHAFYIGSICSVSYLAVYFVRNILSTVTPQMVESGGFTEPYIGQISSAYFIFYAIGQLINGAIGDKIKAKYMISFGLALAGVMNFIFSLIADIPGISLIAYGLSGFCLAMIYGPMTKTVAENTEPIYASRCSIGYTFASFFGSPIAGIVAAVLAWQNVFTVGSGILLLMAAVVFTFFLYFEKKGIVKYNQYKREKEKGSIKVLLEHRIVKFSLISMITGIVRTAVVFWLPTYISQYLGFDPDTSAIIFTVATLAISTTAFITLFVFERLHRNMDLTILIMFSAAAVSFILVYLIKVPAVNLIFMVLAVMGSNGAASMLWSFYCPSLRDTGMVSSATGFLDFLSYVAAAVSSSVFANAVSGIGWGNLILVWLALMILGIIVALPYDIIKKKLRR
ncbi:MAG: MFS transporter [Clostridia bacterium]|nr:MFS transporter [Clostridia bacterium]